MTRLVGRNLRFNREAPPLCCGQPSPLRCALLSPQGLTTLRGPHKSPRAGARRANHHPSFALVAPMSYCFAGSLALLLSLPKELSLHPPPSALQFLAPQRRGTMGQVSKCFVIRRFFPRQIISPARPPAHARTCPRARGLFPKISPTGRDGAAPCRVAALPPRPKFLSQPRTNFRFWACNRRKNRVQ